MYSLYFVIDVRAVEKLKAKASWLLWRGSLLPLGCAAAPKSRERYALQREQAPSPHWAASLHWAVCCQRECFKMVRFLCRLPPLRRAECAVKTRATAETAGVPAKSACGPGFFGLPLTQSGRPERSQARFLCCAAGGWARRANRSLGSARSGTSSSSLPTSSALATSST